MSWKLHLRHCAIAAATVLAAAVLTGPLACAADRDATTGATKHSAATTTTVPKAQSAVLDQKIPAIALPGVPLNEAVAVFQTQIKQKIVIDPQVKTDALITLDMKDTTVRAILDSMCKQSSTAYTVKPDGSIFISTPENIKKMGTAPAAEQSTPAAPVGAK